MTLLLSVVRRLLLAACGLALLCDAQAQPHQMEALGRGVVAVRTNSSDVYVGWRLLGNDPVNIGFNLYRAPEGGDPVKLTSEPIVATTDHVDTGADLSVDNAYFVRPVIDGVEHDASAVYTLSADAPVQPYLSVPLQRPADGEIRDLAGEFVETYSYSANDSSVGDLDGDGEYEIIVKWEPSNARDNAQSGFTGNVLLDAYKLNGTLLWRIDLGQNIRAGAHYTQFMVYDLDGDGKAEVAAKTADGTVDGTGATLGDPEADYRNEAGYILAGPEYLSIFDGETGAFLVSTDYLVPRHPDTLFPTSGQLDAIWGDGYGNRVDRFLAAVAYLDGERPSLIMARGYYTRAALAAYDYRDGELTLRWLFDTNPGGGPAAYPEYRGQGAHSLTVGDVDGDGRDEIVYGAATIDDDGTGLYSTGLGHGDAQHLSDMVPSRPGLEYWMVHESPSTFGPHGGSLHDAATGEILFSVEAPDTDVGRGLAADIDPNYPGFEVWATRGGLNNVSGESLGAAGVPPINFAIWWDDDPLRELLDGTTIFKWNWETKSTETLFAPDGVSSNNGSKANPALSGDILGDWREEVIFRSNDSSELRIYTTTIPARNRLFTLMHDRQYRLAIAWQNVGYNQPPHPSFFLGHDMEMPPRPNIYVTDENEPPLVEVTSPDDGDLYPQGQDILLAADAGDLDGVVRSVAFYVNDLLYGADTNDPYSALWPNPASGTYEIQAVATDDQGAQTGSDIVVAHVLHNDGYDEAQVSGSSGAVLRQSFPGYRGEGFYTFSPGQSFIEIAAVDGGLGGAAVLRIRYANNNNGNHPARLYVNGQRQVVHFPSTIPTGAPSRFWIDRTNPEDNWGFIDVPVELEPGAQNVVRFESSHSQYFKLDEIEVRDILKNQAPLVAIVSPEDGATFPEGVDIPVRVDAYDVGGSIATVDFYESGSLVFTDTKSPFVYDWSEASEGQYSFSATATDGQGGTATSNVVNVLVNNPPTVSIARPQDGAYALVGDTVSIVADADDGQGVVTQVAFSASGESLGVTSAQPFAVDWTIDSVGSYALSAVATDNQGAQTESASVELTALPAGAEVIYPAEEALRSGGVEIGDSNPGYNGSGYADFPSEGGSLRFTRVDGGSGSMALVVFRYALGAAAPRTAELRVNGFVREAVFQPTGGWDQYATLAFPFPLDAGKSNTVEIISIGNDAGNVDELIVRGLQDEEAQVYHAENGIAVGGTFDSNNPGFNGFSFYNFPAAGSLEFPRIDGGQGGSATLLIRYTLGATAPRTGRVTVNGDSRDYEFTYTGSWFEYENLAIEVDLNPGIDNTIRIESLGADMSNVDEIAIVGVTPNELPVTALTSPTEGAVIEDFSDILLSAESDDPDGCVQRVEFYVDGVYVGEDGSAPYEFLWEQARFGLYELVAAGVDEHGARGYSEPVSIEVYTDNEFPTVSIVSPAEGVVYAEGDTVVIEAEASDPDGVVERVRFYAGDVLLGEDESAPFTHEFAGIGPGSYAITAVAVDDYGFETTSEAVEIGALYADDYPLDQEAEAGILVGSYVVEDDEAASGGKLVNAVSGPAAGNHLEMRFNIEDAGLYRIKVWIRATDGSHDSMFVSIDGAHPEQYLYFTARGGEAIIEDYVTHDGGEAIQPYLGVGAHFIRFGYRENLQIDRIALEAVPTTPGGMYQGIPYAIVNVGSGLALDVEGAAAAALARQAEYTGAANQLFTLESVGDGYYNIRPTHSGQYLDVNGARQNNGETVLQWTSGSSANQQWLIEEEADGSVTLTARHSGKMMSVLDDSDSPGADVVQWDDTGSDYQRWFFIQL